MKLKNKMLLVALIRILHSAFRNVFTEYSVHFSLNYISRYIRFDLLNKKK